ncbi:MAG: hypothetical protein KA354_12730 [Phycisphaerae bacterium]|nr:hypothetical protein [Phycisphaerae bacterium]
MGSRSLFAAGAVKLAGSLLAFVLVAGVAVAQTGADIEQGFLRPPDSARPWVYWFWLNGNITPEGITADLEAMKRVGIGGVLIMEVDQGAPVGPIDFMSPKWRELFKFVVAEAERLGLEVNMNDDAGWNGSGGPWIRPEQAMQKVVWTEVDVEGGKVFEGLLAQPKAVAGYYRDIAVLAFPATGAYRIEGIQVKAGYEVGGVGPAVVKDLPAEMVIHRKRIVDLTARMDRGGKLAWDVPAGKWTIVRYGHTCTGVENAPAPATGRGLECDKLSKEGIEAAFAGMMAKLIADVGPAAGKTLVTTHIDSWENGSQNWTARMREEFKARRGYDMMPFLPTYGGRVIDSLEISERFLWDLRQTISDLVVENYADHMRTLARKHGLKLSIEAYGGPTDDLPYAGRADEPMCEFWIGGGAFNTIKEMASAAHIYGKPILGAEAFTANDSERWQEWPGSIKALGDRAFCDGISRFVFHRYAMQPWLDRVPGMTMGPWGLHYERTSTWWDWTPAWHQYLARCQFLLRQGLFVADLCYLQPEASPQGLAGHAPSSYDYDGCSAEAVLTRMAVKNGRIVLPDGMSYRALVLPDGQPMTVKLLGKISELVQAGATVVGPRPPKTPGLTDYPACDGELKRLADELWGDGSGTTVKEHHHGKGRAVWGMAPDQVLAADGVAPDFIGGPGIRYIHRAADETDIYFVANAHPRDVAVTGTFRVKGKAPELWWPDSGRIESASVFTEVDGGTRVLLPLGPSGSVFVVFRKAAQKGDAAVAVSRDGKPIISLATVPPKRIVVTKAHYGPPGDAARTRDVTAKAQKLVDAGQTSFVVARMAEGDDPAFGVVKTLVVDCTAGDESYTATGTDPQLIDLAPPAPASQKIITLAAGVDGGLKAEAWQPGKYEIKTASGATRQVTVPALPVAQQIAGPWELRFPPKWGPPEKVTLDKLASWTDNSDAGIKYFSGTATYAKTFTVPADLLAKDRRLHLDLGKVAVMAEVTLNGKSLGTLWKPPYRVDISEVAKAGENTLEVRVVNLWINRMIGDEQLPEDSARNPDGTLKAWPKWLQEGKPSPTGRYTFTSWRLWKKDEAPRESGLIGPVRLESAASVEVK